MKMPTTLRVGTIGAVFSALFTAAAAAATITGTPSADPSPGWAPNSTNLLNSLSQTPGRVGQVAPHVLLSSTGIGSVTLDFFNLGSAGLAFFEIRYDGVQTGTTAHPVVPNDTIHTGGIAVSAGTSGLGLTFFANETVDVRLALGGERDFDFDWTTFNVAPVPVPAALPLLLAGIGALGLVARRRKTA
ncbi:VPLPA-CTERM sorting domain-containing protein [Jannaschia seohaensis]|uniref:Putative secreted protein n=1 Tax=Jannaschia seohaensis TaxID=475081 RepID=A0A2Y9BAD5_9RHOB|nr:VPLPA-CTERM sorting domain-containing protein [Jannaschia seohaensis]PWJ12106.1 putative secreted protein [Jannaschia seohaensis]SSA51209.1 VPLPA-CTERM protein sorting domain-containing protein [Jannaschia seohaensis]